MSDLAVVSDTSLPLPDGKRGYESLCVAPVGRGEKKEGWLQTQKILADYQHIFSHSLKLSLGVSLIIIYLITCPGDENC